MKDDHLGNDLAVPPVPLKGKLNVSSRRVAVMCRDNSLVIAVDCQRRPVEELEEADRHETMQLRDPARTDRKLGMEPVPALVGVIIPGARVLLETLPFIPACQVAPVGAVDRSLVECAQSTNCRNLRGSTISASTCKIQSWAPI